MNTLSLRIGYARFLVYTILFSFLTLVGNFFISLPAQAATVDDPGITTVSATQSSTTAGGTGVTYTLTLTTSAAIGVDQQIYISTLPASCTLSSYEDCQLDFSSASMSGMSGSITDKAKGHINLATSSSLSAGTVTITLTNVTNPNTHGAVRFKVTTSASDTSSIYSAGNDPGTVSSPLTIGTPFAQGTVTDPNGNPVSLYGQVYLEDWSINQGFNTDEWGYYAIPNSGFSSGSTIKISVYPDSTLGLFTTSDTFTYNGSTVAKNISVLAASKTISGTVTYEDTGGPVTTASINTNGAGWTNDNTDASGVYSMKVSGGAFEVCIGDQYDSNGKRVSKDWYIEGEDQCRKVAFTNDTSTQSETVNFTVKRADAKIKGVFINPDGSFPAMGGWVSFWKDGLWFGGNVDNTNGSFEIALLGGNADAQVTTRRIRAVGSTTYTAQFSPHSSSEYTYWDTTSITVSTGEIKDLGTVTLKEKDIVYTATVIDQNGNPVEGVYVDAWQEQGGWTNTQTNAQGVATLRLYAGTWNIRPSTWNTTNYIYIGPEVKVNLVSGDTTSGSFVLTETTLTVTVTAQTSSGAVAPVNGWANCWNDTGGYGFGGAVTFGNGSFGAIGGNYHCNLWVDNDTYQASGKSEYTFTDGSNTSIDFTMLEKTATANVNVKDQDNKLITASNARVFANNDAGTWEDERVENGISTLRLAAGTYQFGVWFEENNEGFQDYIPSWNSGNPVTLNDGDSITKTLTVRAVTGTLTATLKDASGNPVPNAWVHCGNWPELKDTVLGDFDGGRVIENGSMSGQDGVAVVGLVAGHEYECMVGVHSDYSNLIGPAAQNIDLTKKNNAKATFTFQKANAEISGTIKFEKDSGLTADDMNNVWCNGWAEEGYNSFNEGSGGNYSLNALTGTWHVSCGTDVYSDDGEHHWYSSQENDKVKISSKGGKHTKDVTLSKSQFNIPESYSETFDATKPKEIILSDGTTLNIPAYAFAQSGNVTLTAEPELQAINTFTYSPYGFPWNFEVYDSSGVLISGDFDADITLTVPYNQEILDELNIDEAVILPKYYDADAGVWQNVNNASQDMENDIVRFTLSHFSQIGLVYSQQIDSSNAPKKPRKLQAKKITDSSVLLAWSKRKNSGKITKYKVQVRKLKVKNRSNWEQFKNVKKRKKMVQNLTPKTKYQFRVRACKRSSCSNFTQWKRFKTKVE